MKRKLFFCLLLVSMALGMIGRWTMLNQNVDQSRMKVVSEKESVESNGLRIVLKDTAVYEMPAFVEHYPEVESFYSIDSNIYAKMGMEEAYRSLKYVVSATLEITNFSNDLREIFYTDYYLTCRNQTVMQGVDPDITQTLNNDDIGCSLQSGETVSVLLCYDLLGVSIRDLSLDKINQLGLAIPVSGFPDIKAIALKTDAVIRSTGAFDPYKTQKVTGKSGKPEKIPEDNEAGSILDLGGEIVQNGVGMQVESVQIVKNLKELTEYDPDAWLPYYKESFIHEDGSFQTIAEGGTALTHALPKDYYNSGYTNYAVFVKLKIHNYTNTSQSLYNGFGLLNSDCSLEGPITAEYTAALESSQSEEKDEEEDEKDYYKGVIGPGENQAIMLGYTRSIKNSVNIEEMPLYISNNEDIGSEDFNLDAGKGGYGVYLRVQ